jgi:hypothetical protein
MKPKVLYGDQKFLNPATSPHSGSVRTTLIRESFHNEEIEYCSDLLIKDCTGAITLDFGFNNKAGKAAAIKKANILIAVVTKLRDAIDEVVL